MSTDYSPIIQVIDEHFEIPQLIKTRRIAALLPWNYNITDKRYPVLYLQDGQNLFDDFAPYGSWEMRTRLREIAEQGGPEVIIIAIDHAESERIKEFTPTRVTALGIGDGKKYANFLSETLKPYIDSQFRTLPEPEHTGIGGSSMGGLISIYAAMQHPKVYQKLMIFSPSLWVSPELSADFIKKTPSFNGKIYLYGGTHEGSDMVGHLHRFEYHIKHDPHHRNLPFALSILDGGEHKEAAWGYEFPYALNWLYKTDNHS